jgi:uncharacterized iron-regulated membrane protein
MRTDLMQTAKQTLSATRELPSLIARRRSLFWRIHFWAALIASPFALLATLTGILYIFTPQIESALYVHLDRVQPNGNVRALDQIVAAARNAVPAGSSIRFVVSALQPTDSAKVFVTLPQPDAMNMTMDEHAAHNGMKMSAQPPPAPASALQTVYIDPYTLAVLGMHADNERFGAWAKKLHSQLLQGDGWRWMIELAASWLMVMLLTGIYLWWPRSNQSGLPQSGARGRNWWSQWHSFAGVMLSLMSLIILTTGLTWSKYAGDQIRSARDAVGQKTVQASPTLRSTIIAGKSPMTWQQAADTARRQSPDIALRLVAPRDANGVWRVNNFDLTQPTKRIDLALDAYSGQTLFHADWRDQTAFGKATGIGIPFHRGEFGWWNQLLLLIFGLGILFSLVSGWVMFFKRRKNGTFGLPKLLPGAWRSMPLLAYPIGVAMCVTMPLLALSAAGVLVLEGCLRFSAAANASEKRVR